MAFRFSPERRIENMDGIGFLIFSIYVFLRGTDPSYFRRPYPDLSRKVMCSLGVGERLKVSSLFY